MTAAHPDRALKPIDVPATPLMAAFLSTELVARRVALQKDTGRKVSMARLLHEIDLSVDVDPMVSEETLRRFVTFEEEQAPKPGTLSAIAAYLVATQTITRADLDAVAAADPARLGVLRPTTRRANAEVFARELEGEYRGYRLTADRLIETRLTLGFDQTERRILAAHRVRVHALPDEARRGQSLFHLMTGGLFEETNQKSDCPRGSLITEFTQSPPVATAVQYGGLFADDDLAFAVGLARGQEASTLLSIERILFHEDMPHALTGRRSGRWQSGYLAQVADSHFGRGQSLFHPQSASFPENTEEKVTVPGGHVPGAYDPLAPLFGSKPEDVALFRRAPHVRVKRHGSRADEDKPGPGALGFAPLTDAEIDDDMLDAIERAVDQNAAECARVRDYFAGPADPSEKLARAIDSFQVEEGVKAIEAGADVNARHPRTGEPLIFTAASWSMASLIRAMLATGRLDLTFRDARGNPPSRRISEPELFAELCAEEIEQT